MQESSILDLITDCFHFVTGHFDVISASSPHIYHSALILAPKESIVWKQYKSHAKPFVRVVQGAPKSWEKSAATTTRSSHIYVAAWSPCSKFIAITWGYAIKVDILDPVTLQKLQTLRDESGADTSRKVLIFSPNGYVLTLSGCLIEDQGVIVVSWDLQTGGIISTIRHLFPPGLDIADPGNTLPSITYSTCGKMVGVLHHWKKQGTTTSIISIFDVKSGKHMHSHLLNKKYKVFHDIWTEEEDIVFATFHDAQYVSGWTTIVRRIRFTSTNKSKEIQRFSIDLLKEEELKQIGGMKQIHDLIQINPIPLSPHQFIFDFSEGFLVWDEKTSKLLLDCTDNKFISRVSFSRNHCVFACQTWDSGIFLWKTSPTGYTLKGCLAHHFADSQPVLSPNGELIVASGNETIWLWRTKDFDPPPSRTYSQNTQYNDPPLLKFFPDDGALAAVTWSDSRIVTVFNLTSGDPWLIINAGQKDCGLSTIRNGIIIVHEEDVITWEFPPGDCIPNTEIDLDDSYWTDHLYLQSSEEDTSVDEEASVDEEEASVDEGEASVDEEGASVDEEASAGEEEAFVYEEGAWVDDASVGEEDASVGEEDDASVDGQHPEVSSCGYQVTDDWWVLGRDRKRLFMLPPLWRCDPLYQKLNGQFLVLVHRPEPELVILELKANS